MQKKQHTIVIWLATWGAVTFQFMFIVSESAIESDMALI